VLFSTPVLFALERGNIDLVVLLAILVALRLMRDRSPAGDGLAGVVLAIAAWTKLYPGLLVLGLLALRRGRVLLCFVLAGGVIGTRRRRRARAVPGEQPADGGACSRGGEDGVVHPLQHSLTGLWRHLWVETPLRPLLADIPGRYAAAVLLPPLLLWVGIRVHRCPDRSRLAYPFLLWIVAVATFVPPVANDYNLFFLPMAALAVWDRRDPVWVHMMMALQVLCAAADNLPIDRARRVGVKLAACGGRPRPVRPRARRAGARRGGVRDRSRVRGSARARSAPEPAGASRRGSPPENGVRSASGGAMRQTFDAAVIGGRLPSGAC
jgi:hypothetical protein